MAISHLIGMGHTRIAVVTGPIALQNEQERLHGYRKALQKAGIPIQRSLIWNSSFEQQDVASMCQNGLLQLAERPTALFATNGVTGLAALRSLYAVGLSTPRDFSFVTFDELTAEDFFRPAVTSVVQPTFDMGYQAVEVLLRRIENGEAKKRRERVRLPATLIVRESSNIPFSVESKRNDATNRKSFRAARRSTLVPGLHSK